MTEFDLGDKKTGKSPKIDFDVVEIKINYVNSQMQKLSDCNGFREWNKTETAQSLKKVAAMRAKRKRLSESSAFCLFESLGDLVGAARRLAAAADALETFDDLVHGHAGDELGNALQIAVAAAVDGDGLDDAVFHIEIHALGADTAGSIRKLHGFDLLCVICITIILYLRAQRL